MIGLGLGINRTGLPTWTPRALFADGSQGAWYDPSDLSTLFQDSAGTTPVTATGQPVGLMRDKSGRGNHASQTTNASRPLLQQDAGGRYYIASDGVAEYFAMPHIDMPVAYCGMFALVVNGGAATYRSIWTQRTSSPGCGDIVYAGSTDQWETWTGRGASGSSNFIHTTVGAVTLGLAVVAESHRTSTTLFSRVNGGTEQTAAIDLYQPSAKSSRLLAGGDSDAAASFFTKAAFYGGVIVASDISAQSRGQLRHYLANKSGAILP